jgi:hypothetical protein
MVLCANKVRHGSSVLNTSKMFWTLQSVLILQKRSEHFKFVLNTSNLFWKLQKCSEHFKVLWILQNVLTISNIHTEKFFFLTCKVNSLALQKCQRSFTESFNNVLTSDIILDSGSRQNPISQANSSNKSTTHHTTCKCWSLRNVQTGSQVNILCQHKTKATTPNRERPDRAQNLLCSRQWLSFTPGPESDPNLQVMCHQAQARADP